MARDIQAPTVENGREFHPAFGAVELININSNPGAALFDSEILHQHYVVMRIHTASRARGLHRDQISTEQRVVEIAMSQAQWAQLVSSANRGSTPVTITWTREDGATPEIEYAPRMQETIDEVRAASEKVYQEAMAALRIAEEKPTKANVRAARIMLENATPNTVFAAESLASHVEKTVTRAKADIESLVADAAKRHGLNVDVDPNRALGFGDEGPRMIEG